LRSDACTDNRALAALNDAGQRSPKMPSTPANSLQRALYDRRALPGTWSSAEVWGMVRWAAVKALRAEIN